MLGCFHAITTNEIIKDMKNFMGEACEGGDECIGIASTQTQLIQFFVAIKSNKSAAFGIGVLNVWRIKNNLSELWNKKERLII